MVPRSAILSVFVVFALALSSGLAPAQQKSLNVANWSDYIDPKSIEEFTRETGIKVAYDTYDSNETLETRLLAGGTGYDLVAPTASFLQRQIRADVYRKLDAALLPNLKGVDPQIAQRMNVFDPGGAYSVPYMWSTTGIAYNAKKVRERLGDQKIDSWDIVFKPQILAKLADCGVYVLDSPEDILAIAAKVQGLDPNLVSPGDIKRAADLVAGVRRSIRKFHSSEYINALANGDICLAVGWAGDSLQARNRAREANNDVEIAYVVPREGTLMSIDAFAIPKDAKNVVEAHRFLDFLMRPEVAARNMVLTNFVSPILAARAYLPAALLENKDVFPDEAMMKNIFVVSMKEPATQKIVTREWSRVKLGR